MKKFLPFVLLLFVSIAVKSQPFGNEWINYSQRYFYFKVANSNVYRISAGSLANAGIPVSNINHSQLQLFGRGQQVPLFIQDDGTPGILDGNDFIEFYARANDGYFDTQLYNNPTDHPNPYYSLINDTATYYITWGSNTNNLRMAYETANNFSSFSQSPFFFKEAVQTFKNDYLMGEPIIQNETDADYSKAQGWFDLFGFGSGLQSTITKSFSTTNIYPSGGPALFKSIVVGASKDVNTAIDHNLRVDFRNNNGSFQNLHTVQFSGYSQVKIENNIPAGSLHPSTTDFRFQAVAGNRKGVAWAYLKYPHTTNLGGAGNFQMLIPDHSSQSKSHYEFSNFNASGNVHLFDVTNGRKIRAYSQSGNFKVLVPNGSGEKECLLIPDNQVQYIGTILSINTSGNFANLSNLNADYLIVTASPLWNAAKEYEFYRRSRGFKVETINIEELYHQFAHGIFKNPMAIRNFAAYALKEWATKPEYLFLLGKSINPRDSRNDGFNYASNLVPSFGMPSSDIKLSSGINGMLSQPALATGRIAARNEAEVRLYLEKAKQHESYLQPQEWMKQVLHFGGGSDALEQAVIVNYLKLYQQSIEDTSYGGIVSTFLKTSPAPIQLTLAEKIKTLVNNGVSIMTFFGHAAGSSFDVNIDAPQNYDNKGKYPLLIANSCLAGDIHQPGSSSSSEEFVLIPEKGVIGFLAKTGQGFGPVLNLYTNQVYKNLSLLNYGEPIGKTIQKSISEIQSASNLVIKNACETMTLHGDPAIVINSYPKPDLAVSKESIYFSPADVSTDLDSFNVHIITTNLAKAITSPFSIELTRRLQNGENIKYLKVLNRLNFKDTIVFRLPVDAEKGAGENIFSVFVDHTSLINEMNEGNNQASRNLRISSTEIIPVYPFPFAIVPKEGITLKFNTADLFAPSRKYILEADTTDLFNSPLKERKEVVSSGGIVTWQPALLKNMPANTVYYWRATPESANPNAMKWRESSFQYIPGKEGWAQKQFFQFKGNNFEFIDYNRAQRKFNYKPYYRELQVVNLGNPPSQTDSYKIEYLIDKVVMDYGTCGFTPGIHIAVIDPVTLKPWEAPQVGNCREAGYFRFYVSNATLMDSLVKTLKDIVPYGHYIIAYSVWKPLTSQWPTNVKQAFTDLGASPALLGNNDNNPFIFFVKKGDIQTAQTVIGASPTDKITLAKTLARNFPYGEIATPLIGPALEWHSFEWLQQSLENPSTDSLSLDIIGVSKNGNETLLFTIEPPTNALNPLSIDAAIYPFIKLRAKIGDRINETPAQIKDWKVYYKEAPEASIDPQALYQFYADSVQEGENIRFKTAIRNIGKTDFDSLIVAFYVEDEQRKSKTLAYSKIAPLKADSILTTGIEFSSLGIPGRNHLTMELNPLDSKWQREQFHFNNKAYLGFFVVQDKTNPLMDVTFDGAHILNGDIVSPKPSILIQLKDENKFLALNDTSNFAVYLKNPDGYTERVFFMKQGQEQMRFYPAALPKNSCRIEYQPQLLKDGEYELRVQASDASKNNSGSNDFIISFTVINRSTITEVLNYPNPFSTSTRFVFTLTGAEIPSHFKIQIMTITGIVVKEIFKEDLGNIRIGRNISEYAWDGRDEFGDQLANGVYLYRVITRINNQPIEHRATNADQYFHKGFGKMYLMR